MKHKSPISPPRVKEWMGFMTPPGRPLETALEQMEAWPPMIARHPNATLPFRIPPLCHSMQECNQSFLFHTLRISFSGYNRHSRLQYVSIHLRASTYDEGPGRRPPLSARMYMCQGSLPRREKCYLDLSPVRSQNSSISVARLSMPWEWIALAVIMSSLRVILMLCRCAPHVRRQWRVLCIIIPVYGGSHECRVLYLPVGRMSPVL
jgi:hypothetical protein